MDAKVGDVFVRRSDEKVWTVKSIDGIKVVLESLDKKFKKMAVLTMTDIHGLQNNYDKVDSTPHD
jgi:hypothetical protein